MSENDSELMSRDLETLTLRLSKEAESSLVSVRLDFERRFHEEHGHIPDAYKVYHPAVAYAAMAEWESVEDVLDDAVEAGGLPEYVEF